MKHLLLVSTLLLSSAGFANSVEFQGVQEAIATAHDKVSLKIPPATGGSGEFAYRAYFRGDDKSLISVLDSDLRSDSRGMKILVVSGLQLDTKYEFVVRALDVNSSFEHLYGDKTIAVKTLDYKVPSFAGLEHVMGGYRFDQVKLVWRPAEPAASSNNPFVPNPYAISVYNVYVGRSPMTMRLLAKFPARYVAGGDLQEEFVTIPDIGVKQYVLVRAVDSFALPNQLPNEDLNVQMISIFGNR